VLLARQVGVPYVLVFLNKCDAGRGPELTDGGDGSARAADQVSFPGR